MRPSASAPAPASGSRPAVAPGLLRRYAPAVVLAAVAYTGAARLAPRGLPMGIIVLGLLVGSLNALVAIGLVLVYRAGKYVNFAQGGIGAVSAVVAGKLVVVNGVSYWIAAPAGILAGALLAGVVEILFVKRLFRAPRLIVTVATIGLAQLFGGVETLVATVWRDPNQLPPRLSVPIDAALQVGPVLLRGEHLLAFAAFPVVVAGFVAFFRYSDFGAAVQASAENVDRAQLLGISVRRISTVVWMIAGLLAGMTAVLQAPIVGFSFGSGAGPALLLRALAPAMIARLASLPAAVAAALVLGVVEQAIVWNTNTSGPVEAALFGVVLVALLVGREAAGRTTEGEERSFSVASAVRPFPRELASVPALRAARSALPVLGLATLVAVPVLLPISQQNLLSLLLVYVIAAASLTLLSGYAGQVSFGQWAFVGFGALFGGWLVTAQHLNPFLAAGITCGAGSLLALVVGIPALRIRGLFLGVATLAFAVASSSYLFSWRFFQLADVVRRPTVLGIDLGGELAFYYVCLGVTLAALWAVRNIRESRWGRSIIAVRDNDRSAASFGVSPVAAKLLAFTASGFLASLAGFLYLFNQLNPNAGAFPVETSLLLFSSAVIGGLGTVTGAVVAALYLRGIQYFAPALQLFSTSLGLLLVLTFFPGGLGGLLFRARDSLLRRLAERWAIPVPSLVADRRLTPIEPPGRGGPVEDGVLVP